MKTCPVCQAKAFDDAEVCYGCMHRYEGGEVEPIGPPFPLEASKEAETVVDTEPPGGACPGMGTGPRVVWRSQPVRSFSRMGWEVRVQVVECDPHRPADDSANAEEGACQAVAV